MWSRAMLATAPRHRQRREQVESTNQHYHCECWPCCDACRASHDLVSTDTAPGTIIDNTLERGDREW